ncbi:hypothetical protein [Thalassotalea maritima]|uniref:hypothetical protein n=1 Tax=Thalassotalea maritima TaxID=3242416 RepID=UPI0035296D95
MRKFNLLALSAITSAVLLTGCSTTPDTQAQNMGMSMPKWVLTPPEGSVSSCVPASSSFNIDSQQAATMARAELSTELDMMISNLQKNIADKATEAGVTFSTEKFQSDTKSITSSSLRGTRIIQRDYADINGVRNFCVQVGMAPADFERMKKQVIAKAPLTLSPEDESNLLLEFTRETLNN